MAKILKTNSTAYSYLPESIDAFPQGEVMKALLLKEGFKEVEIKKYTMQTCTFYFATK
jgi:demethylmenaquinone methyltransferase/2-methoxy-6-polyprenyl-1,4-benzoquinol methylase